MIDVLKIIFEQESEVEGRALYDEKYARGSQYQMKTILVKVVFKEMCNKNRSNTSCGFN